MEAIKAGDLTVAGALLDANPALANAPLGGGLSPLMLASYVRQATVAELLLARGARPDVFVASVRGDLEQLRRVLEDNPALVASHSADGWTPLHLAAHFGQVEAVRLLLQAGADVRARSTNPSANTALHAALAGRNLPVTEMLLDAGAEVNAQQHGGYTALQAAAQHGDVAMIELLLRHGADPSLAADDGRIALEMAETGGHSAASELLRL
jgi:ankyrin repeat protein